MNRILIVAPWRQLAQRHAEHLGLTPNQWWCTTGPWGVQGVRDCEIHVVGHVVPTLEQAVRVVEQVAGCTVKRFGARTWTVPIAGTRQDAGGI